MRGGEPGRELEMRLSELERADEAEAPAFRQVLAREGTRRRVASRRPAAFLLGAAAVAAAVALWPRRHSPSARETPPVETLADWKSPTDSLLWTPGRELLESLPTLGVAPPPGEGSSEPVRTKGVTP